MQSPREKADAEIPANASLPLVRLLEEADLSTKRKASTAVLWHALVIRGAEGFKSMNAQIKEGLSLLSSQVTG
jgi:hypothetical protein